MKTMHIRFLSYFNNVKESEMLNLHVSTNRRAKVTSREKYHQCFLHQVLLKTSFQRDKMHEQAKLSCACFIPTLLTVSQAETNHR